MLVATDSCEIYEVLDSDGASLHKGPMLQGHFGNGVRGLAAHPEDPDMFATAGADRTVRIWSRKTRRMVRVVPGGFVPPAESVVLYVKCLCACRYSQPCEALSQSGRSPTSSWVKSF